MGDNQRSNERMRVASQYARRAATDYERTLVAMSKKLTDEGKLIEAGWVGLRLAALPPETPAVQVSEMRRVFMAGAQHVFASIMTMLDPDDEPTEDDMRRIALIDAELQAFGETLLAELQTEGRA